MKRLFKYIVRKVDEKVAKTINSVNECINTVSDKMKDKEDLYNFGMIFKCIGVGIIGLGVGSVCLGNCMMAKSKTM